MKKILGFIVSMVGTMAIFALGTYIILKMRAPKSEYIISTCMSVENNKGMITDTVISYKDAINKDGDVQLRIGVGSDQGESVRFELSFLVNYEQVSFRIGKDKQKVMSCQFEGAYGDGIYDFIIDKAVFDKYNNDFMIVVRKDIDTRSCDNDIVRDSNSMVRRYNLINEDIEDNHSKVDIKKLKLQNEEEEAEYRGTNKITCDIKCLNREEKALIKVKKCESINLNLNIGGSQISEQYAVWGYLESQQIKINNEKYIKLNISKEKTGNQMLHIVAPEKEGIYELEVFCAPAPYEIIDYKNYLECEVKSAQRYTIVVEE